MKAFIINNIGTLLTAFVAFVWLVVDVIRAIKSKNFNALKAKILDVMEYVEQYTMSNGEKLQGEYKLAFAKALLINECKQAHITYNEEKLTNMVEQLIEFSKKVNYNKENNDNGD